PDLGQRIEEAAAHPHAEAGGHEHRRGGSRGKGETQRPEGAVEFAVEEDLEVGVVTAERKANRQSGDVVEDVALPGPVALVDDDAAELVGDGVSAQVERGGEPAPVVE